MTKPNYKPNTDHNSNPYANPNTKQTLILIQVHNFHPNPFQNPQIRTSAHPHFTSGLITRDEMIPGLFVPKTFVPKNE